MLEVFGDLLRGIGSQRQGARFFRSIKRHQPIDHAAVVRFDLKRNGPAGKRSAADPGRRRGVQESRDQTTATHGSVGHDLLQYTGLNAQDR